ncbi:MAG TPA: glucose 1-dehydrogenase [Clostridiales bacterium]|nr:glucose 1-dehydrogenase [Clostridiales bacterium]
MTKAALVTGSGRGIGRGIALELARRGYDVVIHHRKEPEGSKKVAQEISALGRRAEIVAGDLSDIETPVRIVNQAFDLMGRLDVLVNNAGVTIFRPFLEMDLERLQHCYKVDFLAAYLCAQRAAQLMVEHNIKGSIINITSVHYERTNDRDSIYGPMKAALSRATESMAYELAQYGIRVNAVAPGLTYLEENKDYYNESRLASIKNAIPSGRVGTVQDMAKAVAWLASDEADYITGITLRVDGGMNLIMTRALHDGRQIFF